MIDLMPDLRTEVAAIPGVAAIVGANPTGIPRVRVNEPAVGDATTPYRAFVVLVDLPLERLRRLPVANARVAARCYGRTAQEAKALYMALSDGLHDVGPRIGAHNLGIYDSADEAGNGFEKDPDTQQPLVEAVLTFVISTMAVTA